MAISLLIHSFSSKYRSTKSTKYTYGYTTFCLLLLGICLFTTQSFAQITWTNRTYFTLNAVATGPNGFVAVGNQGAVQTSADGITWTPQTSGTSLNLFGITFGNQRYVAIGENGTIITSTDGLTWVPQTSGTTKILYNILFAQGQFVAVGQTGTILTSPDGLSWTAQNSGTTNQLSEIVYGNNQFVAAYIAGQIVTSPDGITWTPRSIPAIASFGLVYANGLYVNTNSFGGILTSPDALTYTLRTQGDGPFYTVIYANGLFVAGGNNGQIKTSTDGFTWTSRTSNIATIYGITYGYGLYVAVGLDGAIATSTDGLTWTKRAQGSPKDLQDIAYGNGRFVAVGSQGANRVSTNGINWIVGNQSPTSNTINSIDYGLGAFILLFNSTTPAYSSVDGLTWVGDRNNPVGNEKIRFRNNRFFTMGSNGALSTSSDGYNWQRLTTPNSFYPFQGIAYGNGAYVAVGFSSVRSTNLTTWDYVNLPGTTYDVTFGNGIFVAVGTIQSSSNNQQVVIHTSPDGITWTARPVNYTSRLKAITCVNNTFIAVGDQGLIVTSPNGITWTQQNSRTTEGLNSISSDGSIYVAVGNTGTILTAPAETTAPVVTGFVASPATVCAGQPFSLSAHVGTLSGNYSYTLSNGNTLVSGTTSTPIFSQTLLGQQTGVQAYTLTIQSASFVTALTQSVTVASCSVISPLTLTQPIFNCGTGSLTFQSFGGDGSEVSYMSVGITGWSTQKGPYFIQPFCDVEPFELYARQASAPDAVVRYTWNYKNSCPTSCTTTVPTSPTNTVGCNSPLSSQGHQLSLLAPDYNCQTGDIVFKPNGGNGSLIEYLSVGITNWTPNCINRIDSPALVQDILHPSSQVEPFVLIARQKYPDGTYNIVQYRWDAKATCATVGRESIINQANTIDITILENPTFSNTVELLIRGVTEPQITLQVLNSQGKLIQEQVVTNPSTEQRASISLGQSAGMYFIKASTLTKQKVIKVTRQ